jgi:large subunit ribosomal protein L10
MNRQEKTYVVQGLEERLVSSEAAFLVGYKGLAVEQMQKLRSDLRAAQGVLKVAKARLMKRAAHKAHLDILDPLLKDQIAFVFVAEDIARVAKVLHDFSQNNALKIVGGRLGTSLLDAQAVLDVAKLPSREILLARLLGVMNAPSTNLARVLHLLIARLLYVLKEIERTKQLV